jgi:hypothetical protein
MKVETQKLINSMKSNNSEYVQRWTDICIAQENEYNKWEEELKSKGVKLVHPDDGWVDREENELHPCYPRFDMDPQIGDTIVLGCPDKYRFVKVINIIFVRWCNMVYYKFEELDK